MIGLLGCGYWGKILSNNQSFDVVYDPAYPEISNVKSSDLLFEKCKSVFVATPFDTHYSLVKKALMYGCDVFCEKPLCKTTSQVAELFEVANKASKKLHVDWIYTYNPYILWVLNRFKSGICGDLISIKIDRLNTQKVRSDANAVSDLMCHDISILNLFSESCSFSSIKRINQNNAFGFFELEVDNKNFHALVHDSGNYPIKQIKIYFQFEKEIIIFDDALKIMSINGKEQHLSFNSPLSESIKYFMSNDFKDINKKSFDMTHRVTKYIEVF